MQNTIKIINKEDIMLEKLHITEDPSENPHRWSVSFGGPEFQGFPSMDIDEKTAREILAMKRSDKATIPGFEWVEEALETFPTIKRITTPPQKTD